ncbi:tyrosine-type recombinase/integrase [Methanosarcina sp. UBA5]|uniref:tyrosine-type recombinase/integrase n=1 Tax=Methanosarcina sp. UBA5 TaxID=1915593 RepID=UPI0025DCE9DE|nr:tyrosine-type recombinase/integrase [Methanosarcina sp. UBA5]
MKIPELKKNSIMQEWLSTVSSDASTDTYLLGMQHFTEFTKKTPEELLEEAEEEAGLLMRKRHIKNYLINFKISLVDRGMAPLSIKSYITPVKSFYRFFDIELPNLQKNKATTLQENNAIPDKTDLQEVLKVCDPLEKAVLLTAASSGLAAAEIISLKISDFKNGYDSLTGITTLKLRRQKTEIDFVTFLTPEATNAVMEYLEFRERSVKTGEIKRQNQLEKQRINNETNFLFCIRQIEDAFLVNRAEERRKFTRDGLRELYRRLSEKARKNTKKGSYNLIRSHNIRKWFNSTLLNAGCDFFTVEELMGHHLPATQDHYFRASPEKLKEIYKKYIPFLTIQKELDLSESAEYRAIKTENDVLRAETAKHVVERQEIQALQKEVARLSALTEVRVKSLRSEAYLTVEEHLQEIEDLRKAAREKRLNLERA